MREEEGEGSVRSPEALRNSSMTLHHQHVMFGGSFALSLGFRNPKRECACHLFSYLYRLTGTLIMSLCVG